MKLYVIEYPKDCMVWVAAENKKDAVQAYIDDYMLAIKDRELVGRVIEECCPDTEVLVDYNDTGEAVEISCREHIEKLKAKGCVFPRVIGATDI